MIVLVILALTTSSEFFAEIVIVSAFFGLISTAAAANNSAAIFSSISEGDGLEVVWVKAKALFVIEQAFAALLCVIGVTFLALTTDRGPGSLMLLFACGFLASISAPLSYCKIEDHQFTRLQVVRIMATALRLMFLLVASHVENLVLVSVAILFSLLLPYVLAVRYTLKPHQVASMRDEGTRHWAIFRQLMLEYCFGVPSALIRGAANSGVLLLSTQMLTVESVKVFRILYMPREYFGRLFGILLPLTFHRIYHMEITARYILIAAGVCCSLFLTTYLSLRASGVSIDTNVFLYLTWGALIGVTYSLLNRQWRDVYRGRQIRNLISVLPGFVLCLIYFFPLTSETVTSDILIFGLVLYYAFFVATRLLLDWWEARMSYES